MGWGSGRRRYKKAPIRFSKMRRVRRGGLFSMLRLLGGRGRSFTGTKSIARR